MSSVLGGCFNGSQYLSITFEPWYNQPKNSNLNSFSLHIKIYIYIYIYIYIWLVFFFYFRCHECADAEELKACVKEKISSFTSDYGVLLFLYSVVLSKVCPSLLVTKVILTQVKYWLYNKSLALCLISSRESICKDSTYWLVY